MESRYINSLTAASLLGVSERAIRQQIATGKVAVSKVTGGRGGNSGETYAIRLDDVLDRSTIEQRLLWYESQSGLPTIVTAADLATYKVAFGEEGIKALADRQQVVMAVDGILTSADRGAHGGHRGAGEKVRRDEPDAPALARGL